ncbi:MAG TPA: hypothetical protein VF624_09925 [Tepidisphaeraceae bacterium]
MLRNRIGDFTSFVAGTAGGDVNIGTEGNDFVYAGDGDDEIRLLAGNDVGIGAGGDDLASGDDGRDIVIGGVRQLYPRRRYYPMKLRSANCPRAVFLNGKKSERTNIRLHLGKKRGNLDSRKQMLARTASSVRETRL